MVTKGFLMFWGGIAGLVITLLLAVFTITTSIKKNIRVSIGESVDEEMIQIENVKKKDVMKTDSLKLSSDNEIKDTEVFSNRMGEALPDTQLMKTEKQIDEVL